MAHRNAHKYHALVAEAKLKPHERRSFLLGKFTDDNPPVGFSTELSSNGSVATQIKIQGSTQARKFVSFVTNNGDKPVNVRVWQL